MHGPAFALERTLGPLQGYRDGADVNLVVFTVPVSAGFPAVEAAMRTAMKAFPEAAWFFGNVYDPVDGVTPLSWWPTERPGGVTPDEGND